MAKTLEVCPECGELVPASDIDDITGWCNSCAGVTKPVSTTETYWYVKWLTVNADEIERTMVIHSVTCSVAKKMVAEANRPICRCCNKPINRGNKRSVFCRTTPACRRAQDVFDRSHHLPREEAIEKALTEVVIFKLIHKAA